MAEQEETSSSDYTLPLIISGVVLALVIYVFSIGPVALLATRYNWPAKPFEILYAPLIWLHDHTPLEEPLENYVEWWFSFGM